MYQLPVSMLPTGFSADTGAAIMSGATWAFDPFFCTPMWSLFGSNDGAPVFT